MKTLVALSRTDWFRLSVYIICKLCNQCPLLSIFKLLFVCDGNVLFRYFSTEPEQNMKRLTCSGLC